MPCPECLRLRREYESAIASIYEAVNRRFDNPWQKIRRLRESQEARDSALYKLHEHSAAHAIRGMQPRNVSMEIEQTSYRKAS